jgi:hypothetical protein
MSARKNQGGLGKRSKFCQRIACHKQQVSGIAGGDTSDNAAQAKRLRARGRGCAQRLYGRELREVTEQRQRIRQIVMQHAGNPCIGRSDVLHARRIHARKILAHALLKPGAADIAPPAGVMVGDTHICAAAMRAAVCAS